MKNINFIVLFSLCFFTLLNAQTFEENKMDCDAGHAQACYDAAKTYSTDGYKEKNYDSTKASHKVATLYKKSCELGYAQGCTEYAMIYTADQDRDPTKSMRYYLQQGCDSGDSKGCTILYMMPSTE